MKKPVSRSAHFRIFVHRGDRLSTPPASWCVQSKVCKEHLRSVWLVQLPIPPLGPEPIRGNVPLAAAYLKLWAEQGTGCSRRFTFSRPARPISLAIAPWSAALAEREPWLVGFTCYLWNIERTLWIARELKRLRPGVRIVLGGPEITADNAWVLETPDYDFAVIGEGEQTFASFCSALLDDEPCRPLPLPACMSRRLWPALSLARVPAFRTPMPDLNAARLAVRRRHSRRRRRADAAAGNDARLRLQVQVLLLPQGVRQAVLPHAGAGPGRAASCRRNAAPARSCCSIRR